MPLEIRPLDGEDLASVVRLDGRAFGSPPTDVAVAVERARRSLELDRFVVATDGAAVVGNGGAFSFELTLPGGAVTPVAGVTWVAVSATHRRRGLMRRLMEALAADARARGESAMALVASEGSIYGHVGYGPATVAPLTCIDPRRAAFRDDVPTAAGALRFLDPEDAAGVLAPLHDRIRRHVPGELSRPEGWWRGHGPEDERHPSDHVVVAEDPGGEPVAYAAYRVRARWREGHPDHLAEVDLLGAVDPPAAATLWRFLLSLDLVGEVRTTARPQDDPLPLWLTDPRQVRTVERNDGLWLRLLDVAAFFSARRHEVTDELVVEVAAAEPEVSGRWRIAGGPDGGEAARTRSAADVTTDAATLASIALGGTSVRRAGRAGRIGEHSPGSVARLARFLRCDPEPFCATDF